MKKWLAYIAVIALALPILTINLSADEPEAPETSAIETSAIETSAIETLAIETPRERIFHDTAGHWAEEILERWAGYGVISGYNGEFRPSDTLTVAEFSTILVRLMNYTRAAAFDPERHLDLDPEAWYFETMLKIQAAGILAPVNGRMNPDQTLTRELSAVMLSRAFRLPVGTSANTGFRDNSDINFAYRPFVAAMRDAGFMRGFPHLNGYAFHPTQAITRAEVVAVFDSMAGTYINTSGIFTGTVDGDMLIVAPDVTLSLVTVGGDIFVAESASGLVFDDVTARRGEILVLSEGEHTVRNSRIFRIILDVRNQNIVLDIQGATNVEFVEMRSGGRILANQNEFHTVRVINIPENFRSGHLVTIEGSFQTLSNRAGADAADMRNARQNVTPSVPGGVNTVTAERIVGERISVEVTSTVLGTAHMVLISDRAHVPTDDEIMHYAPGGHIVAAGNFRVFPGNVETFSFGAFGRDLGFSEQGHVVHVIIESEGGRLERLQTEPIYFTPGVSTLVITSATSAEVNFDTSFPSHTAVEDAFEMHITCMDGLLRFAEFRAFNLINNPEFERMSRTYRLVLLYGEELANGDILTLRPRNNDKQATVMADITGLSDAPFVSLNAVIAMDRSVDFTGTAITPANIFYVLSDTYIPGFYDMAADIMNGTFPGTARNTRFGHVALEEAGPFDFFEIGFPDVDFYYLYFFFGLPDIDFFSPVQMVELERPRAETEEAEEAEESEAGH